MPPSIRREVLKGVLGALVGGLVLPAKASSRNPVLDVSCIYTGAINGARLIGRGKGRIDTSGGSPHDVTVLYEKLPAGFHPFAIGASFITIGWVGARRHGRALNLWDLSLGNYQFERVLTWKKYPTSQIQVRARVVTKGVSFELQADYSGKYDGPTDLARVLLWEAVVTQTGDGRDARDVGRAVVQRASGEKFDVEWDSVYRGFQRKMNVPKQHANMTADVLTFGNDTMRMRWSADVREMTTR